MTLQKIISQTEVSKTQRLLTKMIGLSRYDNVNSNPPNRTAISQLNRDPVAVSFAVNVPSVKEWRARQDGPKVVIFEEYGYQDNGFCEIDCPWTEASRTQTITADRSHIVLIRTSN